MDKSKNPPLRPYLCNLCVAPNLRSLGIGRALCRIVEAIAQQKWSYSHIYLHVDPTNDAAMKLYENEGYVDVGRRWNAFWAGEEISYYVKRLRGQV
jgi:ribosomal protein S18 acetylase RimI-like enzyme